MRIELKSLGFEIPPGLEDATGYTFKDRANRELLTVSFGTRPPEATDLRSLMRLRRQNLDLVLPGVAKIEGEAPARVDGLPGRKLTFTFVDRDTTFRERWAVALPTPQLYLHISYVAPAGDRNAEARFDHICRSVVAAQRTAAAASPPGYVRRWAERMTLDVPVSLAPPPVYQFVDKTDESIRMVVQYSDAPAAAVPGVEEQIAQDASRGAISDRSLQQTAAGDYGSGVLMRYAITPRDGSPLSAYVADLNLRNGSRMHVTLHGPAASEARLRQMMDRFIASVTAK